MLDEPQGSGLTPNEPRYIVDDINLYDYVKTLFRYRIFIVGVVLISLFGITVYNFVAPYMYKGTATFFVPKSDQGAANISGYSQLLGIRTPATGIDGFIIPLIKSRRMTKMLVKSLQEGYYEGQTWGEVMAKLDFKGLKVANNGILYTVSYQSPDPKLIPVVIGTIIHNIEVLNRELELSPNKKLVQILDSPREPKSPFSPRRKFNTVVTFLVSFAGSVCLVFIIDLVRAHIRIP